MADREIHVRLSAGLSDVQGPIKQEPAIMATLDGVSESPTTDHIAIKQEPSEEISDLSQLNEASMCVRIQESKLPLEWHTASDEPFSSITGEITTDTDKTYSSDSSWQIFKDGEPIGHIVDTGGADVQQQFESRRNVIGDKPCICAVCGSRFKTKSSLNRHSKTHTGDKPLKCPVCGYSSTRRHRLNVHMRTHTGEKPYKCSVCEHKCSQQSGLTLHMRIHTREKPFKCSVCGYMCSRQFMLTTHMKSHTGEKPYKCSVCEYRSTTKSQITRHMRSHTGEKPYKCSVCEYRCAQPSNLTAHMRTHTGEKHLKCSVCKYRCSKQSHLYRHMKTHTGEKPSKLTLETSSSTVQCVDNELSECN